MLGALIAEARFGASCQGPHLRLGRGRQRVPVGSGSPTSRRTGWCSAGTSGRAGNWRTTKRARARSRCASSPRPGRNASSWSTATSTAGPRLGGLRDGVAHPEGWPLYLDRYADLVGAAA